MGLLEIFVNLTVMIVTGLIKFDFNHTFQMTTGQHEKKVDANEFTISEGLNRSKAFGRVEKVREREREEAVMKINRA